MNEFLLLKRIKEGDIRSFEQVFRHYYIPLLFYSYSICGSREEAEEIVQELFYNIWKDRTNLQSVNVLKSYLYGAVRNGSLQYLERLDVRRRHQEKVAARSEATRNPEEQLELLELEELIRTTLEQMPERRRRIFGMHRDEGLTYREIAAQLDVSVKTVEAEMSKAIQMLRKAVDHYMQTL